MDYKEFLGTLSPKKIRGRGELVLTVSTYSGAYRYYLPDGVGGYDRVDESSWRKTPITQDDIDFIGRAMSDADRLAEAQKGSALLRAQGWVRGSKFSRVSSPREKDGYYASGVYVVPPGGFSIFADRGGLGKGTISFPEGTQLKYRNWGPLKDRVTGKVRPQAALWCDLEVL